MSFSVLSDYVLISTVFWYWYIPNGIASYFGIYDYAEFMLFPLQIEEHY